MDLNTLMIVLGCNVIVGIVLAVRVQYLLHVACREFRKALREREENPEHRVDEEDRDLHNSRERERAV